MGQKNAIPKAGKSFYGTTIKCQSGRYLAFYEHRTDIVANGDSEIEAKKNLKEMYAEIMEHEEAEEEAEHPRNPIDPSNIKHFTEQYSSQ